MIGILIDAGILGIIVAVMDDGDMPDLFPLVISSLAIGLSSLAALALLPQSLSLLSVLVGAVVGGLAISFVQGMSVKRSCIAASVYLVVRLSIAMLLF